MKVKNIGTNSKKNISHLKRHVFNVCIVVLKMKSIVIINYGMIFLSENNITCQET